MKHQEDTRDGENDEEKAGDSAEAEGIGELKAMALHLHREDVEEEVIVDQHGPFEVGIGQSRSEDRPPDG